MLIIGLVTAATVTFHYGYIIPPSHGGSGLFHAIHGRLCYIPIILGAIWFGVRGGISVALLITALTLPYGRIRGITDSALLLNEYTEMVFYLAIGLTSGILIELQRYERRRREALSKELALKEHLSSLGQMAAGLAHEIKNPLGSIQGSAEILGDDFPPGSRKHELLQVLTKESHRLSRVVEDFLSFARPRPLERTPTQVNDVVRDVVSQAEIENVSGNVSIVPMLDPDLPQAPLDSEKIHQVFLNIILNAIAAMPDGGTLTITTRKEIFNGETFIAASFTDTGHGISKENLEKIFDPFFTTRESGTGLGLSISHVIIQNHNGKIEIQSTLGKGTSVTVLVPIKQEGSIAAR
ncbi:MAG: hypothetical protein GTO51_00870 [Candidatus Latescibacteria bacterium]|nr:hypothetical protein [Candidatus Latescibacterota bacterium]NIM64533.1 hypothetical protein [Candidatus Latescibacterota bacterium]NIO00686.1 hypothetical protein [Candidatus Latescibacterota bacterium]NIO27089.1 hypothetical protein [Candidatus Latescibacterota bacterium]NIT00688.1 hypothetical protein [Candidatus Latescibacterota bacterium]